MMAVPIFHFLMKFIEEKSTVMKRLSKEFWFAYQLQKPKPSDYATPNYGAIKTTITVSLLPINNNIINNNYNN